MSTLDWAVNQLQAKWNPAYRTTSYCLWQDLEDSQSVLGEIVDDKDCALAAAADCNEVCTVVTDLLVSGRAIANDPWDKFDEDTAFMLLDFEVGRTTVLDFYQRAGPPMSVVKIEAVTEWTQLLVNVIHDGEDRVGKPVPYDEREAAYREKYPNFRHPKGPLYDNERKELIAEFDWAGILLNYRVNVRAVGVKG